MPNLFTSRSPRDRKEINTCIAMVEDSAFWDNSYALLGRDNIVDAWEWLLSAEPTHDGSGACRGYIDIIENESYAKKLRETPPPTRRNQSYEHHFHSVWFVAYLAEWFLQEIIAHKDIADVGMHFMKRLVEHRKDPSKPCPVPTSQEIMKAHHQEPGYHLYNFSFFVWHPNIAVPSTKVLLDAAAYINRLWKSATCFHGGVSHHAWINNVSNEFIKKAMMRPGHQLLRDYPDNGSKSSERKKYLLCLTKDQEISDALRIPQNIDCVAEVGGTYNRYFGENKPAKADLTLIQQHAAYLIYLGYNVQQVADIMKASIRDVNGYQHSICRRLHTNGYEEFFERPNQTPAFTRENLQRAIEVNMQEIRTLTIFPLYPWPADFVLRG